MKENREDIRFPASDVQLILRSQGVKISTICKDISLGGIKIPETLVKEDIISMNILFSPYNKGISSKGKVAWSMNKNAGIRFVNQDSDLPTNINKHISFIKKRKEPNFLFLLNLFSSKNRDYLDDVFYTTLKVLYFKQFALKIPLLKPKMILYALDLVKDYIFKFQPVPVIGELERFFRKGEISDDEAADYCNNLPKEVKDIYGRVIELGYPVFDSLFKDPETGKKIKADENFNQPRAKRLPWVVYTLQHATQIYEMNERDWITYYYTMPFLVEFKNESTGCLEKKVNHFLIITKKKQGIPIKFVTAYTPDDRLKLFRKFCNSKPYNQLSNS